MVLEVSDIKDNAPAHGHLGLPLTDTIRLVIRKSTYIEPATIGTIGSKPPAGLKESVTPLRDPETVLIAYFDVLRLDEITSVCASSRPVLGRPSLHPLTT